MRKAGVFRSAGPRRVGLGGVSGLRRMGHLQAADRAGPDLLSVNQKMSEGFKLQAQRGHALIYMLLSLVKDGLGAGEAE